MERPWTPDSKDQARWVQEAEYFDEEYSRGPISPAVVKRYKELRRPWLKPEFRFHVLGDVSHKRILELGCGDGSNAILLGLKGASVVGIDISPRAIEIATERAALHGVGDRVTFVCSPLEVFVQSQRSQFDIICGFAVLHHLLPVLDSVLAQLDRLAHPGTRVLFGEPVNLWGWLRRLRLALPVRVSGTPDERPLNGADLAIVAQHWPGLQQRYFGATTRVLDRLFPLYESMTTWQRWVYGAAAHCDNLVLHTLRIQGLGSYVVLYTTESR